MARITIEDCLEKIPDRFELVLVASKRARLLSKGAEPLLPRDGDKDTVLALREIAEGLVDRRSIEELETKIQWELETRVENPRSFE